MKKKRVRNTEAIYLRIRSIWCDVRDLEREKIFDKNKSIKSIKKNLEEAEDYLWSALRLTKEDKEEFEAIHKLKKEKEDDK